jgi:hypothetical protein
MAVVLEKIGRDDDAKIEKIDDDFQAGRCLVVPADEMGFMSLFEDSEFKNGAYDYVVLSGRTFLIKIKARKARRS